jgi:hypothetical protein
VPVLHIPLQIHVSLLLVHPGPDVKHDCFVPKVQAVAQGSTSAGGFTSGDGSEESGVRSLGEDSFSSI